MADEGMDEVMADEGMDEDEYRVIFRLSTDQPEGERDDILQEYMQIVMLYGV